MALPSAWNNYGAVLTTIRSVPSFTVHYSYYCSTKILTFYCIITVQHSIAPSSQANNPLAKSNAIKKLKIPPPEQEITPPNPPVSLPLLQFSSASYFPLSGSPAHPRIPYHNEQTPCLRRSLYPTPRTRAAALRLC